MSNITNQQPVSPSTQNQENPMDHYGLIENLFNKFLESGGQPKVTEFKRHIDKLIKDKIKPLCSSQGKSHSGSDWRSEQKTLFSGRGEKWCKVSIESLRETLSGFEKDGIDVSGYNNWISQAGYAWIRYAGPRVVKGTKVAGFEVRTEGSTIDHPKQLHYIDDSMVNEIEKLGGTPHSMKLESKGILLTSKPVEVEDNVESVNDETPSQEVEVTEEVTEDIVNKPPQTDDPQEWEEYLKNEGLGSDQYEDHDQLNDDMF